MFLKKRFRGETIFYKDFCSPGPEQVIFHFRSTGPKHPFFPCDHPSGFFGDQPIQCQSLLTIELMLQVMSIVPQKGFRMHRKGHLYPPLYQKSFFQKKIYGKDDPRFCIDPNNDQHSFSVMSGRATQGEIGRDYYLNL